MVYHGPATVVDDSAGDKGNVSLGLALFGDGVDIEQINAIAQLEGDPGDLASARSALDMCEGVNSEFKVLVADFNTFLVVLRSKLDEEEKRIGDMSISPTHKARLETHTLNVALNLYGHDIHRLFDKFHEVTSRLDNDTALLHKRYFRVNFHPHLMVPFTTRAYEKPLGYAGDYGLMVMLYEYDDLGNSLFEKFIHRLSCEAPSAVANKNRVIFLSELMHMKYVEHRKSHSGEYKVSTIACGPAREITLFMEAIDGMTDVDVSAVCVDQEERALEYAQREIRKLMNPKKAFKASFIKEDVVLGLIRKREFASEIDGSHLITCAGLFDYLSPPYS